MRDMTKGSALEHLWKYALPLLLGNWFQMGYNAVDSIIVGRFIGKDALAAVGIASPVMNLVILSITGLCLGAGVLMSEFFGAKDLKSLHIQFSTTLLSGAVLSIVVTLLGTVFVYPVLRLLAVPGEILDITATYVRITFFGAPFTFFYNALSAALKSVGDAKTPLKFLMFASILNGVLDVIFIGGLGFGIICSATTTVIAEAVSAILAAVYLIRKIPELCPEKGEWTIDRRLLKKTLQYGGVTALQQSVQPIGKLLIQGQINALGVDVIAAYNAVTKVDAFALVPGQSIAQAITTYIAQNRGAKKEQRIRHGFAVGMGLEVGYWIFICCVTMLFKVPIMSLFVTGEDAGSIIVIGVQYLSLMSVFYLWPAMTNGVQGFFRGVGRLKITLLGTFIQTSVRVIMTYVLAPGMGIRGIAFACVAGWSLMLLVEVPLCVRRLKQVKES
ncbi:MAG: MATE family efflux transporter [Lachnospiraceae bacterium]